MPLNQVACDHGTGRDWKRYGTSENRTTDVRRVDPRGHINVLTL
ncbi:hypothetical protein OAK81_02050 [Verrucomicrobiales bacterium]|nr:hypothetical protein [Verrucomicrobiales bacterium]